MTHLTALLRTLLRDRAGIASLEAGLVAALLLVPLLGGVTDAGMILLAWSGVTRAEQAALLSAWANGASPGAIAAAALAAYGPSTPAPSIAATIACYCLPNSATWDPAGAGAVGCTSACVAGDALTQFVTVSVGTTVALPLPLPGAASPYAVAATATARLR